jgi:hypothetical protein
MGKLRIDEIAAPGAGGIAGLQDIYIDSSSHKLSMVNSAGTVLAFQTGVIAATGGVADTPNVAGIAGALGTLSDAGHTHLSCGGFYSRTSELNVNTSAAETDLVTASVPAGLLAVGTTFRIKMWGTIQWQATSGTFVLKVYLGATASGNVLTLVTQTNAGGPFTYEYEALVTVTTAGSGTNGKYVVNQKIQWQTATIANPPVANTASIMTAPSTTANLDTTITETIKVTGQFATSSATNIFKVENATIECVKL